MVNRFAVSFWSYAGYHKELQDLAEMVHGILQKMKSPVPDGLSFITYYELIWGTDKIMEVNAHKIGMASSNKILLISLF